MAADTILDAIAAKAETVAGIKRAYGVGIASGVAPLPDQIADGPVALVMYDGTTVNNASSFEDLEHRYTIHVYVAGTDTGFAYKRLVPYVSAFNVAFRTGRSLDGACAWCLVSGADAIESVEINGRPYNRLPVRLVAREITPGVVVAI